MNKKLSILEKDWFWIICIINLCLLSRLPSLLSPGFNIDFDESILGIMAQHALNLKELPFYFTGQSYGFSWIETLAVAGSFAILKISYIALALPMLLLWTLGCCFYYRALAAITNRIWSFLLIFAFIMSPAWMAWSLKARGGYISAFLLSGIVMFLVTNKEKILNHRRWFYIGMLFGLILLSQATFAFVILTILVLILWEIKSKKIILSVLSGFSIIFIFGKTMLLFQKNRHFWNPDLFSGAKDISWDGLYVRTIGAFLQESNDPTSHWIVLITIGLIVMGIFLHIFNVIRSRSDRWSNILFISLVVLLASSFFLSKVFYCRRHFLAISVFLFIWLGTMFFKWWERNEIFKTVFLMIFGILIILGLFSSMGYQYRSGKVIKSKETISENQKINDVISFLNEQDVKYVYSENVDLFWKILFLSQEKITARWKRLKERYPEYSIKVDRAFFGGQKTALVGPVGRKKVFQAVNQAGTTAIIDGKYFIHLNPSEDLIFNKLRFQRNNDI